MKLIALLLALWVSTAAAQQEGYRLPPPDVVALVDAPASPGVEVSPDARFLLIVERGDLPSIEDVTRPWLPLAGVRIDPAANMAFRTGFDRGLVLSPVEGGEQQRIPLPEGAQVVSVDWSHTSRALAYTLRTDAGLELWAVDVAAPGAPVKVTDRLNGVFGQGFRWMPDGSRLLVLLVPAGRGAAPERARVPGGPVVQETSGDESPLRTYQDLLADEHDAALFEHYGASQLALWTPESGKLEPLGRPGLVTHVSPSPDGEHLLVTELHRPFSYLMPYDLFPGRIEVRALHGGAEHLVADVPLGENIPIDGVRTGPRSVQWKAGEPATLVWVEALDGGDPRRAADERDRWLMLKAPFEGAAAEVARLQYRAGGVTWMEDPSLALFDEYDRDRRWTRSTLLSLVPGGPAPRVIDDRSARDQYGNPGRPLLRTDVRGSRLVRQDGTWIYRAGEGAMDGGARPFLARLDLATLASEELWRSAPGCYEAFVAFVRGGTESKPSFVARYESPSEPPNWRLRDLAAEGGSPRALTSFPDPQPALRGIHKELITYARPDGVPLSATLYVPKDHVPGTRLPLFVWAYPREFNDAGTAGQVSGTPFRFTRFSGVSHLYLLTQGYAVLDDAAMPVIGDPETMNDTFIEQISSAAAAAIDTLVERGIADRERVALGGHSYGAFMTANLLAHTDLFKAGIARSGAYNRTLTPFGFQSERRTLWEAPEAYAALSPFLHADGIREPLLLIHGGADNNPGTFPLQSERLYQAIKGLGGTARYVVLPGESHGYQARESVLHALAEMIDWLDRHLAVGGVLEAGLQSAPGSSAGSAGGR
jgi:dipeptidyl aminopeptidase/acylaminoacyl peptidase